MKMDYDKLIEKRNNEGGFSEFCGIKITKIKEGCAEAEVQVNTEHFNSMSIIHGGMLFTLADTVGGACARSHGYNVTTVNANIEFLQAGANVETLYAYAKTVSKGNKIYRVQVDIFDQLKHHLTTSVLTFYTGSNPAPVTFE